MTSKKQKAEFRVSEYPFYYMWHIVSESQRKIQQAAKVYGVKGSSTRVILLLHERGSMTLSDLAKEILFDNSRVSRIVKELEEEGVVLRLKNERDQRYSLIELTDKGIDLFNKISPIARRQLDSTLDGFTKEEIELFRRMIKTMKANAYRPAFANPDSDIE